MSIVLTDLAERLGTLTMRAGDGVIAELPLVAPEAVARLTWWDVFRRLLRGEEPPFHLGSSKK